MLHDQVILLKKVKKSQKEGMKMKKIKSTLLIMLFISMTSISNAQDMIQIKGSDTLINLVQKLAEVYMQENPGKYISVSGGGSGTGVAGLINSKCDILASLKLSGWGNKIKRRGKARSNKEKKRYHQKREIDSNRFHIHMYNYSMNFG